MRETTYQFRAPFVIDASKFQAAFGHLKPTPHGDAVQQTLAWYPVSMTARHRASRRSAPISPARPTGTLRAHDSQICTALVLTLQATPSDARRLSSLVKCPLSDTEPCPATPGT